MRKKCIALLLVSCLLLTCLLPVHAADNAAQKAADTLYALGLFNGSGTNPDGTPRYDLDKSLSRQQAVTLLVRLLGKDTEAKEGAWKHPFTDIESWADPYIGYAYEAGLSKGSGTAKFGANDPVNATQYLTFVLRALGYSSDTDFAWDAAWELTDKLGITSGEYNANKKDAFLRSDVVKISVAALSAIPKGEQVTLLEKLVSDGAVSGNAAEASGLMPDRFLLFARALLNMEAEEYVLTSTDGKQFDEHKIKLLFGSDFDLYRGFTRKEYYHSTEPSADFLADALEMFAQNCIDGDYRDSVSVYMPRIYDDFVDHYIFTDGKGVVIGYGFILNDSAKELKLYRVKKDAHELADTFIKDFEEKFNSLTEVACKAVKVGKMYHYTFSGIPESAVSICKAGTSVTMGSRTFNIRDTLVRNGASAEKGYFSCDPVSDTYETEAFFTESRSGKAHCAFYFLDASNTIVGYAVGVIQE